MGGIRLEIVNLWRLSAARAPGIDPGRDPTRCASIITTPLSHVNCISVNISGQKSRTKKATAKRTSAIEAYRRDRKSAEIGLQEAPVRPEVAPRTARLRADFGAVPK